MILNHRIDLLKLVPKDGIGIELGVAQGWFSHQILKSNHLSYLYSVDAYAGDRGHDDKQYMTTLALLKSYEKQNMLLRLNFNQALLLFNDEFFDFIYIDGYAHTGQEDGETLRQWYPKLKIGGVFSGDDYDNKWPKVVKEVDSFAKQQNKTIQVIKNNQIQSSWERFPSWYFIK